MCAYPFSLSSVLNQYLTHNHFLLLLQVVCHPGVANRDRDSVYPVQGFGESQIQPAGAIIFPPPYPCVIHWVQICWLSQWSVFRSQNLGTIRSSNLCTEIIEYSSPDEIAVCNLASIALPRFVSPDGKFYDFKGLAEVGIFSSFFRPCSFCSFAVDTIASTTQTVTATTEENAALSLCVLVCLCACICTSVCVCLRACVRVCAYMCTYIYVCACLPSCLVHPQYDSPWLGDGFRMCIDLW